MMATSEMAVFTMLVMAGRLPYGRVMVGIGDAFKAYMVGIRAVVGEGAVATPWPPPGSQAARNLLLLMRKPCKAVSLDQVGLLIGDATGLQDPHHLVLHLALKKPDGGTLQGLVTSAQGFSKDRSSINSVALAFHQRQGAANQEGHLNLMVDPQGGETEVSKVALSLCGCAEEIKEICQEVSAVALSEASIFAHVACLRTDGLCLNDAASVVQPQALPPASIRALQARPLALSASMLAGVNHSRYRYTIVSGISERTVKILAAKAEGGGL